MGASERLPARFPLHPGMEKLLLGGHADTDSACVALSPAVGAQRVMLQRLWVLPWDQAGGSDPRYKGEAGQAKRGQIEG